MSRKNETMTVRGFGKKGLQSISHEQPFSDSSTEKHFGMPVTPLIFVEMLDRFRKSEASQTLPFKGLAWVEFSKASIFRILAQENCEFIRFCFCIPEAKENKASLALQGLDGGRETIKKDVIIEVCEKIANGTFGDEEIDEDVLMRSLKELPPPMEEKGNGGSGFPIFGEKNVKTLADFYEWLQEKGKSNLSMDLATFTKEFFEFADKK